MGLGAWGLGLGAWGLGLGAWGLGLGAWGLGFGASERLRGRHLEGGEAAFGHHGVPWRGLEALRVLGFGVGV